MGNGTESTYAYNLQRKRWQGMLLTDSGNNIIEKQKYDGIDSQFSTCGKRIK